MRLRMWASIIIISLVVAGGVVWFNQFLKEIETENRTNIDEWIDKKLSEALSQKINYPTDRILKALHGTLDSEIISQISNVIHSIDLTFTRLPVNRDIQISLNIMYEDGKSFSTTTQRDWDSLPESIRAEFLRSGGNTASRLWEFPWASRSS